MTEPARSMSSGEAPVPPPALVTAPGGGQPDIDRENPWPGLASFTERQSGQFFGRNEEAEELFRLLRREGLTVLHGQSGLGKTSLLQAGLFPRLRQHDFLPVLLRVDYSRQAPPPVEQVKLALARAIHDGSVDAPLPTPDRSLWEYFHDPATDFWSPRNRLLTPVLVFDQFEELFTIGQTDEESRRRAEAFVAELACLVENAPPPELATRAEAADVGPAGQVEMDPAKSSGKVVLSLRSDFLAELESLQPLAHGLTRNRMRLLRMTGVRALEVVGGPVGGLVEPAVARQIVRFVAGEEVARDGLADGGLLAESSTPTTDAAVEHLEVEPALLSLVCRELNARRQKVGLTTITADLLAGHRQGILIGFYEQCLDGMPAAVRRFIEDHLLTRSGYRNNVAVEDAVANDGVTCADIDRLVSGRLLRTDDRVGVLRVELAHDVLTAPVRASRDARQGREAIESAAAKEKQAARELRAARRRLAAYLTVAGAVIAILCVVTGLAIASRNEAIRLRKQADENERQAIDSGKLAEEERRIALSRQLSAQALNLGETRLDLALLLDLEAYKLYPNIEARGNLLSLLQIEPHPAVFLSGHTAEVHGVAFSDNGKIVASSGNDGLIILWDAVSRRVTHRLTQHGIIWGLAFAPGGKMLASGGDDGSVLLWDLTADPPRSRKLTNTDNAVTSLAFSPDGSRLGVGIDRQENDTKRAAVELWDVDQTVPKQPARLHLIGLRGREGQLRGVHSVAFSHDGRLLAAGCRLGPIVLWDLTSEPPAPTQLLGHQNAVESVAFSPNDKLLASGGYDSLLGLWDVEKGAPLRLQPTQNGPVWSVAFIGNTLLASAQQGRVIQFWDAPSLTRVPLDWVGHDSAIFALAVSPDRKWVASAGGDGLVLLWNAPDSNGQASSVGEVAQEVRCGNAPLSIRSDGGVAFAAGGRLVAAGGSFEDQVYWLDPTAQPPGIQSRSPAHQGGIERVAASSDGRFAASAGIDGSVVLWDLTTDPPHGTPLAARGSGAGAVAFSADSSLVAAACNDPAHPILLWDVAARRPLQPLPSRGTAGGCVAFGPAGSDLLAWGGSNGSLNLWRLKQRAYVPFSPPSSITSVLSIAFSSDGKMAFSGRNAGRHVYLWDLKAARMIDPPLDGPGGDWVFGLDFSPDGKLLAGASGEILLWDVASHHLLGKPFHPLTTQFAVSFSPDSKKLAAWSGASNVCLIDVDLALWMARAKVIANRELTAGERQFFLGRLP